MIASFLFQAPVEVQHRTRRYTALLYKSMRQCARENDEAFNRCLLGAEAFSLFLRLCIFIFAFRVT